MGYGIYDKSSGEASSLDSIPDDFDETDFGELSDFDSRIKTKTTNMNFTLSQNFKVNKYNYNFSLSYFDSDKEDELLEFSALCKALIPQCIGDILVLFGGGVNAHTANVDSSSSSSLSCLLSTVDSKHSTLGLIWLVVQKIVEGM